MADDDTPLETCREWPYQEPTRCNRPAEFIIWGKLFPSYALGPRCYEHASQHIGQAGMRDLRDFAVFDLRNVRRHIEKEMQRR